MHDDVERRYKQYLEDKRREEIESQSTGRTRHHLNRFDQRARDEILNDPWNDFLEGKRKVVAEQVERRMRQR